MKFIHTVFLNTKLKKIMATFEYLGILPKSSVTSSMDAIFVETKIVHGKLVDYYDCIKIIEKKSPKINKSLITELTNLILNGNNIFQESSFLPEV